MMTEKSFTNSLPGRMLPVGSQVVLTVQRPVTSASDESSPRHRKPGAVGVIRECPSRVDGLYLVEFANGETVQATFSELTLRRTEVDQLLRSRGEDMTWLPQTVIYRCIVGSRAYGLANEASDEDIRGIYQAPAERLWSLYKPPPQVETLQDGEDVVLWELERFLELALKANPNVLEVLWSPMVVEANETAEELRGLRRAFLSKHLYKTYSGYVLSQFRRMENSMKRTGTFKAKHAMHLIRLLLSGLHVMSTRELLIDVGEHREELLRIRTGEVAFEEIKRRAMEIDGEFQMAFEATELPEQPDFERVNDFLIRARRSAVARTS